MDRGIGLAARVEQTAPAAWLVPSQRVGEPAHVVSLVDGYLRCDCFARLAGHPCAHVAAVALLLVAGPLPAETPAAPLQPETVRHPRREVQLV